MGPFRKMKEPVFLKESSNAEIQLEKLRQLEPELNEEGKAILRQEIRYLEYGIEGEKSIAYELKNSHMPMYILHDLYLEDEELSAQIDYLVITRKICFVIECKNLYGNIEINNNGDFIRTVEWGGKRKKEGVYSPITQNERHLELMKKIKADLKSNFFSRYLLEKSFDDFYKSIVVLANPRTMLNARYAKKEIKEKVIRADQLITYIKNVCSNSKELSNSDEGMKQWAESFLSMHRENKKNYLEKYDKYRVKEPDVKEKQDQKIPIEETDIFQQLRTYRWETSQLENVKPYFICNDNQLRDLISKMPQSREELLQVSGFGEIKVKKYGDDILRIIKKYS